MLRLLLESNRKGFQYVQGAFPSLLAHSLIIAASVVGTRHGDDAAIEAAEERVTFLVLMNRTTAPPPRQESVAYVMEGEKAGTVGTAQKVINKKAITEAAAAGEGPEEDTSEDVAPDV